MHLQKLELQGFKTFAKKTQLSFLPPANDRYPITAIVGPNGSGKSNIADAIRWVLGEQSLKLLRGKKTEDVIFSGSEGKGRSGFAQVSLTFNNEDHAMPLDFQEIVIVRRLFRDGTSEYILNESPARLSDIQLLLAQANVGQRSYSVIGQGMIDHILVSTPQERKTFFDDATGVKPLQMKRHDAVLKLARTHENLTDVEMLLREIEPRVRSLKRQATRLEQRSEIETQLHDLEAQYYGSQWWELAQQLTQTKQSFEQAEKNIQKERDELQQLENQAREVERAQTEDVELRRLQDSYRALQKQHHALRQEQFELEKKMELAKLKAQSNWAPLPLIKIVQEVEEIIGGLEGLRGLEGLEEIRKEIHRLLDRSQILSQKLQRPNPEDFKSDPAEIAALNQRREQEKQLGKQLAEYERQIDEHAHQEKTQRSEFIHTQKMLREKQQQIHLLENRRNAIQIDLVRFEEREHALIREMDEFMKERAVSVRTSINPRLSDSPTFRLSDSYPEIQRLRYQLELIGGIDPEIMKEYNETKERHDFLSTQFDDLTGAIKSTEKIIKELDEQIEKQSKVVFAKINKEFERYFKILFGGGSCALVKLTRDDLAQEEEGITAEQSFSDAIEESHEGVDIQATPPGKKLKALNLLSGGERALTSIALVSAIMAVNPAPFVVLDEVDAALDEANTVRFAAILDELSQSSQFILITHNRATMEKADVLYGVTMGTEGISNLLSVHLEEMTKNGTARR